MEERRRERGRERGREGITEGRMERGRENMRIVVKIENMTKLIAFIISIKLP